MGLFLDGYKRPKKDKKKDEKKTEGKKPQSSSASRVNERASKSTALGGGYSVQQVQKTSTASTKPRSSNQKTSTTKPSTPQPTKITKQRQSTDTGTGRKTTTTRRTPTTREMLTQRQTDTGTGSKSTYTRRTPTAKEMLEQRKNEENERRRELEQRQNQKMYGDQKRATPRKTTTTSNNLTQHTTAAQRQKMGMPTAEDLRQGREHRRALANSVKDSVRRATSEENKSFMQRQKSGIQTEADRQYSEKLNQRRAEVAKNTGRAATKGVQDTLTGYGKTLADVDEMAKSNKNWTRAKASKMGISEDDTVGMAKVEGERQKSIKQAQELRRDLAEKQDKRQAEFDERTKNAKGLEKAWYGAVESGTGMATDALVGALTGTGTAGSLASMGVRTYGTTRGQAEKEGATENEDRAYALLQAAKEVGTELMFPGAGLAKKTYGKVGLSVADRVANKLTKGLTGNKADLVGAGVRLLGGTAEENAEELAGWGLDPIIKELTYGKKVRTREAQKLLKQESDELRSNLKSAGDARSVAAYLGSDRFLADNIAQYKDAGLSDKQAREVAEKMRDYLTASLTGDTDRMGDLEDEIVTTVAGGSLKAMIKDYDVGELMDTFASTSVLTLATGLPATATTAMKGARIRENLGSEGLRALSQTAINFEDDEASLKGQAARDRLDSGKDLTSTQVFDLAKAQAEQIQKDEKRVAAMSNMADNAIKSEKLVTPKIGFRENGSVAGDEIITMNYVNESNNATEIISDLLKEEGSESLTDTEVQTGSRAIAGFKTGAFTVNDANALNYTNTTVRAAFEAATGVNLSQYVVRKNGQVDIPATNAATKDALFAMAADNFVKTAQAETANWMDSVKGDVVTQVTERMGAQGSLALQQALDDVDERDRSTYMMNANAADMMYQTARNMGTEWDSVKAEARKMFPDISETKLEAMYNAGLRDRADAANGAIGQQVRMGEAMALQNEPSEPKGKVFVDTTATPKGTVVRTFSEIASNLGVDIHLVDDLKTSTGGQANGQYVNGAIYINMNSDFESNIGYIFMHEVTHHLKQYAPEQFNELENLVREKWFGYNPEQMQNEIAKKIDLYKRNGQTLSEEEALEEIIADAAHEFINDRNFADQVAEQNPDIAKAILNGIRNALRMLRRLFAAGSIDDETHMNSLFSQLNILDEAEKLWLNAYTQAVQNKAAVAIDEWQDKANKQNSPRLSVPDYTQEEMDADYMKAVESNDMDTAQRMVDEAAEKAMPNTKLKGRWYHGTENEFTVFNFSQGGKNGTADGYGIYLTNDPKVAESYGQRMIEGYVNVERPASALADQTLTDIELHRLISRTVDVEAETLMYDEGYDNAGDAKKDTWISNYTNTHEAKSLDDAIDDVVKTITQFNGNDFDIIQEIMNGMGIRDYEQATAFYDILTEETGIDGFETKWGDESEMADPNTPTIALAFRSNQIKDASPVTYDDNGKPIPLSERFNQESQDIRFSLSEPVERVKDLIAVHNLKPEDIRNTFELGGFPMPSIAVTKDSMGHDQYGDITLMFHSDTIDPKFFRSNQVFGGDAWTPTFPSIAKKVSRKVADKVDQKLRDILGLSQNDYTLGDLRLPALDDDNLTNALRYNDPYEAFKNDEVFQIAYLKNAKNFDIAVPTKEGRIRNLDKQALEYLDDKLPELTYNDIYDTVDHTMEYEPAVRQARKDYYESKGGVKLKALAKHLDEKMGYSDVISRLEATIKFRENGIPEVTDQEALRSILNEKVDQEGYKAWIDDLFDGIIEKTGIRNDKDMFTSSGKRRSWESLHDPVTLENVVKVMRTELAAGGTGIFGSNPKGAAQKQYKSLDEIRADKDRLQQLSEEEYKAQSEEAVGKMSEVCVAIAEHNPKRFSNRFGAALDVGSDIAEILNSTRNRNTIQRKLKKDYLLDVTDEQMDDLMEAIDAIANLPTGYFEAKPRRAVGFDEVKAAVIPANTDTDIKEGLSERGITTYEYDPDTEGDRTAKVNEAATEQDLRFSISENSSGESLTEWQQEYFRNSKIVDADGRLKVMYHGTPNMGFTVFDLKKAKPGTLGRGFYFTDSKTHAGNHGQQMEVYLNIENPLQPDTYNITKEQLRQFVAALAEDEDYGIDNYGYDATVDSVTDSVWGRSDFQMLHDLNLACVGDLAEACRLFNYVNGTNYDGIVTAVETLAMRPEQIKLTDNLAPTSDPDIRFSVSDDEYLLAVEKYQQMYDANEWGWLQAEDEIQRMVDQAAIEAGYSTKAYHGTDAEFNVFKRDYIAHGRLYGDGFYFSPLEEIAGSYGSNVKPYFLKTGVLTERELMSDYLAAQDYKDFADKDEAKAFSREKRQQFEKYGQGIERFRPDVDIVQGMYRVIYTTVGAFQNGYIMVATEPEYIKSAEPIVKDDNGNVIPLSKRFNDNSVDTRFSISATDSQGNPLTEAQRQYFGNSQARDSEGRLVPVYHTTNKGGFTVFDPMRSDDHRSLFFASNWDVSQTYGNYANSRFYQFDINNLDDVEKYLDAYGPDFYVLTKDEFKRAGGYEADFVDFENEGPQYRFDAIQKKWKSSNRASETRTFLFKSYIEDVENGDIDPDDYVVIVGVPDYSPDNRSYSDTWILANSPNELVSELKNHFLAQQNTYSGASTVGTQHGYYQCYLNLENPLIIDAQGQNWNDISDPNAVKFWIRKLIGSDRKPNGLYGVMFDGPLGEYREGTPEELSDLYNGSISGLINKYDISIGANSFTIDRNTGEQIYGESSGNTRYWAERAEAEGHDGVIFRNLLDIGGKSEFDGLDEYSDIYIAFSSNQVKDINNENPTENPDIRYSITDDDEAMSHMAHDYAYDNSYEALAYYEEMISADEADETVYQKAKNYIAKDVDEFYAGLTRYADGMKFDDPILEEGRTRMAKSKQDFFNSNKAKWNDRWLTDGEVLDIKSVEKAVRDLVTGTMLNSNTNRKYSQETVKKTLIDMRLAYFYAKQGRTDVADALLWHSAHRMIDGVEFYREDGNFETYKRLRDYFKDAKLQLGEDYWNDVDYAAFRKMNFGRLNLVRGKTNLDKILDDLYHENSDGSIEGIAVEWFNPEAFEKNNYKIDSVPDILLQIADVLDTVEPYAEAYSSEYYAEWATDIASDLLDIMQSGKELQSTADKYKKRYDEKAKAMKARHAEAMLKVRQQRDEGIKRERVKFKEYVERKKEKQAHNKYFDSIQKSHKKLTDRLLSNTADSNIPQQYKKELAKLLAAFDLQTVGSKKVEARRGVQGQKTIKMAALKTALNNIENRSGEFHVSDAITDIIDELLGKDVGNGNNRGIEGMTIDELNSSELARIDKLLKALVHEFNTYKTVKIQAKRQQVEDIGKAQVNSSLEHAQIFGQRKDYNNITGVLDKIVNMGEMTPAYMFRMLDPNNEGIGLMWKEIRRSFDRYVRNQNQLNDWMDEIIGEYHQKGILWNKYGSGELSNWRSTNYQQTFVLTNGAVTLTPAQMMSLYCLSKRNQAYGHMVGAGIVVAPVSFQAKIMSDIKKKPDMSLPVILTDSDIKHIVSKLTPDQIKVADKLQELMATKMAAWGNEASMNVLGIELFGEPDYFPIKSDKAALEKDLDADQFANAIRNFGFTKAVQPGARNAIMIDDIFDVVAEHCNNMNLYNSYSEAMNDFMKVYNYRDFREDGREYTVQQAIAHAYSRKATTYIMQFMKDLNGNVSGRSDAIENAYNTALGNAKKAAVFANLRVAAQQPTAIVRAFAEINPKYIKGIRVGQGDMKEMMEHCPIALWKSWGYYDINMGKSIEDIMMNNGKWLEDKATDLYGALDNVTWTAIWQMVKAETRDKHPELKEGTDEFFEHCNERMSEIVDFTQVVDSPMHRSHDMRSKNMITKLATSFMAEPTLTFNMVKDGMRRAYEEYEAGSTKKAAGILQRTFNVFIIQAGTVAVAAALVDALRKKKPDKDDEDDRFLHLWWVNTVENFYDNIKLWHNIYFVKDIASMFEGWDNNNLALQGWKDLATGWNQLTGNGYVKSSKAWYENMAYGLGYLTGIPVKTMMTGISNFTKMFGVTIPGVEMITEELDALPDAFKKDDVEIEPESMAGKLISIALSDDDKSLMDSVAEKMGYKRIEASASTDKSSSSTSESEGSSSMTEDDLPDNLTDEQKKDILKAGEKRAKKAETEEAQEQLDYDKMLYDAMKAAAGLEGEEYNKKIYSSVAQGLKGYIADGDYTSIGMMRTVIEQAGGDVAYFDQRVMEETKSAYKKTLVYAGDMYSPEGLEARNNQKAMFRYMMNHGMTQEELSSEVLYHSELAKDMKVAYRVGDNDLIYEAMLPLVDAGITELDLQRLYENRNKMDLTKYKQNGRFKDKLKSMGTFIWPTEGVITSHFGYRNAPTAGASSNHPAIDIGAPTGTPVVAADGGVVISAGANGGYGNSVGIKHDNGMITWYNHLSGWNVKVGDTVGQGQQIAQVGSTGISTGPHLDFKIVDKNGNPVDPEKYLNKR